VDAAAETDMGRFTRVLFQAANYLPRIFGANQYALLQRPELLPTVLLDWMRRLVTARQA
jgi:nitric oxide reductase activation protein